MKYLNKNIAPGHCQRCALHFSNTLMLKLLGHNICVYCWKDLAAQIHTINKDLNLNTPRSYHIRYVHIEDKTA